MSEKSFSQSKPLIEKYDYLISMVDYNMMTHGEIYEFSKLSEDIRTGIKELLQEIDEMTVSNYG